MLCRNAENGDVQDLNEEHSATLAWLASGKWVPVESDAEKAEVVETPEKPAKHRSKATARPETR